MFTIIYIPLHCPHCDSFFSEARFSAATVLAKSRKEGLLRILFLTSSTFDFFCQPFRVTLRFIGHSVAIHLLPPTPVPTTNALHYVNAEASDSGTSSSNGEGIKPHAKLRQLDGDATTALGNHNWLRGGHGKGDHGNTIDHSKSSSSSGEEEATEQFTLTAVEVEVSQGPERAVRLLIDDSTCLKSSALLSAATHGQVRAPILF